MKVKEFIELLQEKYPEDAELYFTTSAYDCEVVFDKVEIDDFDTFRGTNICLTLSEQNVKDFTLSVLDERREKIIKDWVSLINKYFY